MQRKNWETNDCYFHAFKHRPPVLFISLIILVSFNRCNSYARKNNEQVLKDIKADYSISIGDSISDFQLVNVEKKRIEEIPNMGNPELIFIFSEPCKPCNSNIAIWKRIVAVSKKKASVYGVILHKISSDDNYRSKLKLNFDVMYPLEIERFKKDFQININLAQTILVKDGKVNFIKFGELEADDYFKIQKKIKEEFDE